MASKKKIRRAEIPSVPDFKAFAERLFPYGTNPGDRGIKAPPDWPPDLFAFAASVAERFGVYAEEQFTAGWDVSNYRFDDHHRRDLQIQRDQWAANFFAPQFVLDAWSRLVGGRARGRGWDWRDDIIKLLILSDEASRGAGFEIPLSTSNFVAQLIFEQFAQLQDRKTLLLPNLPSSLCLMVPPDEACVQPKTNTPRVGCTLRSLSHHLSLLPPVGVVRTGWIYAAPASAPSPHFNVLLIPFPFRIEAGDFFAIDNPSDPKNSFFGVRQGWMERGGKHASAQDVFKFIMAFVKAAERETRTVHAIVLPELALPGFLVEEVAKLLAAERPSLELFVSGVLDHVGGQRYRNCAFTACLLDGEIAQHWRQQKHHRWCLEVSQIKRYDLGFVLDPERNWWELIDVSGRTCSFTVVRPSASIATLICEDLARFDPLMPVINSIGPNLLLALLMDGPQMERRWPGRYATVLADDPGTSVLSLTSLGMIERSNDSGQTPQRQVALWKEAGESARELTLPLGHHALVLSLTMGRGPRSTLDMRSEDTAACRFRLSGVRPISLIGNEKFPWTDI